MGGGWLADWLHHVISPIDLRVFKHYRSASIVVHQNPFQGLWNQQLLLFFGILSRFEFLIEFVIKAPKFPQSNIKMKFSSNDYARRKSQKISSCFLFSFFSSLPFSRCKHDFDIIRCVTMKRYKLSRRRQRWGRIWSGKLEQSSWRALEYFQRTNFFLLLSVIISKYSSKIKK